MFKKNYLILVFLALLAVGCAQKKLNASEVISSSSLPSIAGNPISIPEPTIKAKEHAPAAIQNSNLPASPPQDSTPTPTGSSTETSYVTVYEQIGNSPQEKLSVAASTNALTLLKKTHVVDTINYGSLGDMVVGIDGLKADNNYFWEFFVNGESSEVGAGGYIVKNNDSINWKFDKIN